MRADVSVSIARAQQELLVEPALRLRQPVADFLEPPGEPGIVEHEADVIFDDAQSFPRAIGGGIENSPQIGAAAGLAELERRDPLGERQWGEIDLDGLGESLAQRLEIKAAARSSSAAGPDVEKQARKQMLGPHFSIAVRSASLHDRLVQDLPQGRREGQCLQPALDGRSCRLRARPAAIPPAASEFRAESGPETVHLDAELDQKLASAALRLGGQGGQQIEWLDDRSRFDVSPAARLVSCSPRTGRE